MVISKLKREKLQWSGKFTFIEKKSHRTHRKPLNSKMQLSLPFLMDQVCL